MTYSVYSQEQGVTIRRGFHSVTDALLFMINYDRNGEVPLVVRDEEDRPVNYQGEAVLTPVRSPHAYSVQVQTETGWVPHMHTDDLEDALYILDETNQVHRRPVRVVENANGNIVRERFPFFNEDEEKEVLDFDWRTDGF